MAEVPSIQRPPPITAVPRGLLSFLGIKSGGAYPKALGDTVVPVMELWRMTVNAYAAAFLQGPVNGPASQFYDLNFGTTIGFVPQTQVAYVEQLLIRADLTGIGAVTATPCCFVNGLGLPVGPTQSFATGDLATFRADEPFWMPPGSALGIIVNRNAGGLAIPWFANFRSVVMDI